MMRSRTSVWIAQSRSAGACGAPRVDLAERGVDAGRVAGARQLERGRRGPRSRRSRRALEVRRAASSSVDHEIDVAAGASAILRREARHRVSTTSTTAHVHLPRAARTSACCASGSASTGTSGLLGRDADRGRGVRRAPLPSRRRSCRWAPRSTDRATASPRAAGIARSAVMLPAPADSPNTVTLPGSPPKRSACARTKRSAAIWSSSRLLAPVKPANGARCRKPSAPTR